ncbi:MAG TPA: sigma-70 family RNA polymerase sigma factor [Blastocatellia bacterium]|nr:sigma-70 family RNA polymerase sigma factor [Blastocatellia bacterium]
MEQTADNFDLATVEPDLRANAKHNDHALTDEALVESIRAGDDDAFEELFLRHRRRVARIIGRFFSRPERVDEIIQDVFAKIYFALGDYSADRGKSFSAWLSRVTVNACYDELRRARSRRESSISEITDDEAGWLNGRLNSEDATAESSLISRDLATKLLARLSPEDRMVLTLMDAEDVTVAEVAALTGWKTSKVKVRAYRARHALRRVLGEFL